MLLLLQRRTLAATLGVAMAASGCSLVYDDGEFARTDAAVPDAAIDPTELVLDGADAPDLFEGMAASEGTRAIPVVLTGSDITAGATVEVSGAVLDSDTELQVSRDGRMAAIAIRIPVDTEVGADDTIDISITLSQAGVSQTVAVQAQGLDELESFGEDPFNVAMLAPRYSRIDITSNVELVGDVPARLVAMDSISVSASAKLDADARDGDVRAAGGHLGGSPGAGGNGTGAGSRGIEGTGVLDLGSGGGGGAGNKDDGSEGQGDGGEKGTSVSAPLLSPFTEVAGSGGGGGSGSGGTDGSGEGGNGGGAIELRAMGPITLANGAAMSAAGAAGGPNAGLGCPTRGAGGGGAGGALMLRSDTSLEVAAATAFDVSGGAGGNGNGTCDGGSASDGRIRLDAPVLDVTVPSAERGPSWLLADIPTATDQANPMYPITGGARTYFVEVDGDEVDSVELASSSANASITLNPGLNRVCVLIAQGASASLPETRNCFHIAHISQ